MRLEFFNDLEFIVSFLDEEQFPFHWTIDQMQACCLVLAIKVDDSEIAGFLWFEWMEGIDHILFLHHYISSDYRRLWLDASMVESIRSVLTLLGAKGLAGIPLSGSQHELGLRIGYQEIGPYTVIKLEDLSLNLIASSGLTDEVPL